MEELVKNMSEISNIPLHKTINPEEGDLITNEINKTTIKATGKT